MKVLKFIIGKGNKKRPNGVNQVIGGLSKYLNRLEVQLEVIGLASNSNQEGEEIEQDGFRVKVYSKISLSFIKEVKKGVKWCDVLHVHGVYNIPNILVLLIAIKHKKPFIITPHNGFSPELRNWKKRLFDLIIQKHIVEKATGIHAITEEESTEILNRFNVSNIFLANNAIDIEDYQNVLELPIENHTVGPKIILGYLGRISPEKNLGRLVEAVNQLNQVDFNLKLKIAGPKSKYLDELLNLPFVEWIGPCYDKEKINFLKSIDLFIHPSNTDVFSITAIEALVTGTPLLITRASKVSYYYDRQAFYMCETTVLGLKNGIIRALENKESWFQRRENGRAFVKETLNWKSVAEKFLKEYKSVTS